MTRWNVQKQGWVFPLFSRDSDDWLSLSFHRFVILYKSCDTRSVGLGQYCLPKVSNGFKRPLGRDYCGSEMHFCIFLSDMLYVVYLLNNTLGNPYHLWKDYNKPVFPTRKQFVEMRKNQVTIKMIYNCSQKIELTRRRDETQGFSQDLV